MWHKFISFVATLILSLSIAVVSAQDCPTLVKDALSRAQTACAIMRGNQACYGYPALDAKLQKGLSQFAFNGVGDITPVDTIESLNMSALNPVTDEWGVALMRVRADITPDQPNQNVTLLAFGEVSIDPDKSGNYQPMQAFALQTGATHSGCTNITENGLIIQTPEGVGRVTLWINDVRIRIGSTVLFQAQPGGDLVVSTFEGHAEVQAEGGTQEATTGMQVRVPMDADMHPTGVPTTPESFDADSTGLSSFLDVATSFTEQTVVQLIPTNATSDNAIVVRGGSSNSGASESSDGSAGAMSINNLSNQNTGGGASDGSGCNREHGTGNGDGTCNGHQSGNR